MDSKQNASRQNKPRSSLLALFDPIFNANHSLNVTLNQVNNESIQEDESEIYEDCESEIRNQSSIFEDASKENILLSTKIENNKIASPDITVIKSEDNSDAMIETLRNGINEESLKLPTDRADDSLEKVVPSTDNNIVEMNTTFEKIENQIDSIKENDSLLKNISAENQSVEILINSTTDKCNETFNKNELSDVVESNVEDITINVPTLENQNEEVKDEETKKVGEKDSFNNFNKDPEESVKDEAISDKVDQADIIEIKSNEIEDNNQNLNITQDLQKYEDPVVNVMSNKDDVIENQKNITNTINMDIENECSKSEIIIENLLNSTYNQENSTSQPEIIQQEYKNIIDNKCTNLSEEEDDKENQSIGANKHGAMSEKINNRIDIENSGEGTSNTNNSASINDGNVIINSNYRNIDEIILSDNEIIVNESMNSNFDKKIENRSDSIKENDSLLKNISVENQSVEILTNSTTDKCNETFNKNESSDVVDSNAEDLIENVSKLETQHDEVKDEETIKVNEMGASNSSKKGTEELIKNKLILAAIDTKDVTTSQIKENEIEDKKQDKNEEPLSLPVRSDENMIENQKHSSSTTNVIIENESSKTESVIEETKQNEIQSCGNPEVIQTTVDASNTFKIEPEKTKKNESTLEKIFSKDERLLDITLENGIIDEQPNLIVTPDMENNPAEDPLSLQVTTNENIMENQENLNNTTDVLVTNTSSEPETIAKEMKNTETQSSPSSKVIETAVKFVNALTLPMFIKPKQKNIEDETNNHNSIDESQPKEIEKSLEKIEEPQKIIEETPITESVEKMKEQPNNIRKSLTRTQDLIEETVPEQVKKQVEMLNKSIQNEMDESFSRVPKHVTKLLEEKDEEIKNLLNIIAETEKSSKEKDNKISQFEKILIGKNDEITKMQTEMHQYKCVLEAYDRKIPEFIEEYNNLKQKFKSSLNDIAIFRKPYFELYEKLKKQEESFNAKIESIVKEKEGQIAALQQDIQTMKANEESTSNRTNALVKRFEMKVNSLENALKLKNKEFEELSSLYDSILQK